MTRSKRIPQPMARILEQRPRLSPDASRSNHRIDELDAQNSWQHHTCPEPVEGKVR